jgi:PadR family transcriptional regulator PadR
MVVAGTDTSPRESLLLELRRGAIVLAVLSQLHEEEYGYSLKKLLAERGLDVDEGTLYPLLRRLEAQGLLRSRWRVEDSRPRRYYRLSGQGEKLARELNGEWKSLARAMDRLLG